MRGQRALLGVGRRLCAWGRGVSIALVLVSTPAWAGSDEPQFDDMGLQIMARLQRAAHDLDYTGIFTFQQGQTLFSSQIAHIVDESGERQRVEVLDSPAQREFIRHNNIVESLVPERQMVLVDERDMDHFPGLFSGDVRELAQYYAIELDPDQGRVAGRPCRVVHVVPRDELRWGYQLCVDLETNLLLKVQTRNAQGDVLEQIAFSEVHIGPDAERHLLRSPHNPDGWQRIRIGEPVDLLAKGWEIGIPAGFKVVRQWRRNLKHKKNVHQVVLSDGLAAISIFIEDWTPERGDISTTTEHGATSVHRSRQDDFWLTVLGEVPIRTVRSVAAQTRVRPDIAQASAR